MQYELAPMEGITGYIYRNAYVKYFGGIDRYYTPFIANTGLNHKELNDVLPEHNAVFLLGESSRERAAGEGPGQSGEVKIKAGASGENAGQDEQPPPRLVPQILTNKAEDFLLIADRLWQMGYSHVNLNLGCPSGTVASRGRGAGFLAYPRELEAFLEEIYEKCPLSISIKTRIGVADMEDWEELLEIYGKYPVEELIIHPRIQRDFYRHPIRWEGVELALKYWEHAGSSIPLCYNGEIHSLAEYRALRQRFPQIERVMLGRGVLKNPFLAARMRRWEQEQQDSEDGTDGDQSRKVLWSFHQELLHGYREIMSGDQNALFKMKELWTYFGESFPGKSKAIKKIRKAGNMAQYEAAVREVFGIG